MRTIKATASKGSAVRRRCVTYGSLVDIIWPVAECVAPASTKRPAGLCPAVFQRFFSLSLSATLSTSPSIYRVLPSFTGFSGGLIEFGRHVFSSN